MAEFRLLGCPLAAIIMLRCKEYTKFKLTTFKTKSPEPNNCSPETYRDTTVLFYSDQTKEKLQKYLCFVSSFHLDLSVRQLTL